MTIIIDGKNERGHQHLINYFTDYTILYSINYSYTGKRDRETNKFEYEVLFRFKCKDFIHFNEEKFILKLTKQEYIKAFLSVLNQHIMESIMNNEIRSLYIDLNTLVADDTMLDLILKAMDEQEKKSVAAMAKRQEEAENGTASTTEGN